MNSMVTRRVATAVVMAVATVCAAATIARAADGFYQGKEVRLLIGTPVGGGYDTYGRFFARHLPRFLPGSPNVVAQNMPGAAGVTMANHLYHQAPKDGTVVGSGAGSIATAGLFGASGARYDARRFTWIGSLNSEVGLVISWHDSPVKTAADLFTTELITGGSGHTDGNVIFPNTMNNVLGTKFKVIPGYKGTANIALALERGEVKGMGSWHYSSIMSSKPDWLAERKVNVLVQLALKPHPKVPGVPTVVDLAKTDEQRAIIELVFAQQDMGRPFFAPPDVPAARVADLRGAFDAMVRDAQVLREAEERQFEINQPMAGAAMLQLVERLHAMPKAAIDKAGDVIQRSSSGG